MVKRHIKRISAPRTWKLMRKEKTFISRPNPGVKLSHGISITVIFRDMLKRAKTAKEAKRLLLNNDILVNKKKIVDEKLMVGLLDAISIPKTNENFRLIFDEKGKISLTEISEKESNLKVSKIQNKTKVKGGKTQLNLSDSRNMLIDKDEYKTGDSLLLEFPGQKIKQQIKMEKNAVVYLLGGKKVGSVGTVEDIHEKDIKIKLKSKEVITTLKKYALVIGKEKQLISVKKGDKI